MDKTMETMLNLYPGDIVDPPYPAAPNVKWRVRERKIWPSGIQYTLQLYSVLSGRPGEWGWHHSEHDCYMTPKELTEQGFNIVVKTEQQLELF